MPTLVTGCPRSGTLYMATLLTAAGLPTAHEGTRSLEIARRFPFPADSSWFAAPFLRDLPRETRIIHLVRDPLEAVSSAVKFWRHAEAPSLPDSIRCHFSRLEAFRNQHCPGLPTDEIERENQFYLRWNRMIEEQGQEHGNYVCWLVPESITAENLLTLFLESTPAQEQRIHQALLQVPRNTNTIGPKQSVWVSPEAYTYYEERTKCQD